MRAEEKAPLSNDVIVPPTATHGSALSDFVAGMYDEAIHHPMKLATEAVIGGAATVAIALAAPEVAAVATTVGACVAAAELGSAAKHLLNDMKIVNDENQKFSPDEVAEAHRNISKLGASTVDTGAAIIGGIGGFQYARTVYSFTSFIDKETMPGVTDFASKAFSRASQYEGKVAAWVSTATTPVASKIYHWLKD